MKSSMDAFLTSDRSGAIPITPVRAESLGAWLDSHKRSREWLDRTGFKAEPGTFAFVPGSNGSPEAIVAAPMEDAATVRGEFPDAQGQLRGVTAQKRVAAVTLRLPLRDDAAEVRVVSSSDGGETELGRVAYPKVAP